LEELELDDTSAILLIYQLSEFRETSVGKGSDGRIWPAYKQWLLETQKSDMITLSLFEQSKNYDLPRVLDDYTSSTGFGLYFQRYKVSHGDKLNSRSWGKKEIIGENTYFETPKELQKYVQIQKFASKSYLG
jgi:hypothetical protein